MSLANCNLSTLNTAAKCFNCLSLTEKNALRVYFLAQAVKAAGGPDYTNVNVRNTAAACFDCVSDFVLDSMEIAAWQNLTQVFGVSLPTTINGLRAAIKCDVCGDDKKQRAAFVLLLCQLSANVST